MSTEARSAEKQARKVVRFANMTPGDSVAAERFRLPMPVTREWAWGGSDGAGVRVCVIDSGVAAEDLAGSYAIEREGTGFRVVDDEVGDVNGHGTACAAIIRRLAPRAELTSMRILGETLGGSGEVMLAALRWAVQERFDVVNLSLSTRRLAFKQELHDLVDEAYFNGIAVVASAHNSPVDSFPWRFPSVISVGSHSAENPERIEVNLRPPVEFFAMGVQVEVPLPAGGTARVSGNSFATPHVSGLVTRIRSKHPYLGVGQIKHVLSTVSDNLAQE